MDTMPRAENGQKTPAGSLEQEVYLDLVRTAARVEHAVGEALKPYGLTRTQYNVLRILRGARPIGLCRSEVQARMLTPVPDATRLLDRLAEAGLVVRDRDTDDRRFVTTRITEAGLELLGTLDRPIVEMHERQFGHMSHADLRRLSDLLREARAG